MKISVIGSGYVGLATTACLAEIGNKVAGIDINRQKIKQLGRYLIPIYEPGFVKLKSLLQQPIIFDGRNIYDPKRLKRLGFRYFGNGR